ncbi:MAG: hypothetical protein ABIS07_05800 [Dokdonella sp.]
MIVSLLASKIGASFSTASLGAFTVKIGELKSLGHNIADSLASGIGLLIGVYDMDIFGEAAASTPGFIEVDFLCAKTSGSVISPSLQRAINLYCAALPALSAKQGIDVSLIRTLTARFGTDSVCGAHFRVIVEDVAGRRSVDQYIGSPGRRFRAETAQGR